MDWSRSGAGVSAVRTADGRDAYQKVTPAVLGPAAMEAARRELRFYREVAPAAPVRTPELLDGVDAEQGVTLLLADAGERIEVTAWTTDMWAALGRELAALHNMPLPAGWSRPEPGVDAEGIAAFWSPVLPQLNDIISRRAELLAQMAALPAVFTHGDCHTDNIVRAGGSLVFCDWQAAGAGRPGSDLAFLSIRGTPAGVTVPPALVDAYLEHRPVDRATLERAMLAEELAVLIFQWPPFAAFNSPEGIARIQRRGRELTRLWFRG
jgi:fructosamine-3-kinase